MMIKDKLDTHQLTNNRVAICPMYAPTECLAGGLDASTLLRLVGKYDEGIFYCFVAGIVSLSCSQQTEITVETGI